MNFTFEQSKIKMLFAFVNVMSANALSEFPKTNTKLNEDIRHHCSAMKEEHRRYPEVKRKLPAI
jgi:hypothetical protein